MALFWWPPGLKANSLYRFPLQPILPGVPTARVIENGFLLALSELGQRHPVTVQLPDIGDWGRWMRHIELLPPEGRGLQQEFLCRLAHWLMSEPELEEEALCAEQLEEEVLITRGSLNAVVDSVEIVAP